MKDQPSSGPASDAEQAERLLEQARKGEQDARAALAFLTLILNRLPVALMVQDEDGNTLLANERAAALYSPAVSASEPKTAVLPAPAPAAGLAGAGVAAARDTAGKDREDDDDGISVAEDLVAGPDGERTLLSFARPARVLDRGLRLTASVDFTERKLIETELSKRAYFDDLTGLPNRTLIEEHVEQLLLGGSKPQRFALAFLDIDNFKHINDYYTHSVGDALLVKVAQRITSHLRSSDILSRISGDEFLLVLNPLTGNGDLAVVDSLLRQLKEPFLIEGFEILTSASMGVSVYPDHGLNYEMLRRGADTAMYRIKASAKGGAALFDADMGRSMAARMGREQRLRLAVRDGRFCCAFQPKVDIRTEEIVGVEALIRLRDEEGMIQAPSEFIGLAVELGLIERLTYLALGEIIRSMDLIDEGVWPGRDGEHQRRRQASRRPQFHARLLRRAELHHLSEPLHGRSHRRRLRRQDPVPDPRASDAARDRRQGLDRRLRHRLFIARRARRYHRRRTENRPLVHHRHPQAHPQPERAESD